MTFQSLYKMIVGAMWMCDVCVYEYMGVCVYMNVCVCVYVYEYVYMCVYV